ncbi:tRNA (adenine(37)-N6)-methyltransferase isoform X1 [Gadus macrocephalus]|uniref:tRNA (adenine(37)-N6)-methyltransferase isoform X1 n=1 Tax=Gadus macrocephalus TaxID=80720 RepID=UPI0028CB581E|nr:tRNA (adenine(37)-N6)-methyltransferase isoform X1 [Gadus macrocephalus]
MPPLCESCFDHVDKLNQQVSVMRKEIKNLRQMLENAVKSHRKHMTSLLSAVTNVSQGDNQPPYQQQSLSEKTEMAPNVSLEQGTIQTVPIGYIRSCFSAKNGTPRQPTVCGHSRATLCIQPSVFNNPDQALMGLEQFSHVWVIFLFHKNGHLSYKPKVKPPRLNGQRVGLYSTRTPHRPNALGLTLARVDKIVGDTVHLSGIDMIDGTPVLDIKPYISDYDSPLSRPGAEPYQMDVGQPETAASPQDEVMGDVLSIRMNSGTPSSGKDTSFARDESTKVTGPHSSPRTTLKDEAITADVEKRSEASSLPVADANADSAAPFSKELRNVLVEVKAYINDTELTSEKDITKSKRPETTQCNPRLCYGEEEYSTIATWIRAPPVGNLEVRFTPHALSELAKFIPPQHSDPTGNYCPRFKFLRSQEEALAAIRAVLSADPRSIYRRSRCEDRLFFFTLDTADITCWFGPGFAEVLRVRRV